MGSRDKINPQKIMCGNKEFLIYQAKKNHQKTRGG